MTSCKYRFQPLRNIFQKRMLTLVQVMCVWLVCLLRGHVYTRKLWLAVVVFTLLLLWSWPLSGKQFILIYFKYRQHLFVFIDLVYWVLLVFYILPILFLYEILILVALMHHYFHHRYNYYVIFRCNCKLAWRRLQTLADESCYNC